MNPDLALVLGIVIAGFSIPAIVSLFLTVAHRALRRLMSYLGAD